MGRATLNQVVKWGKHNLELGVVVANDLGLDVDNVPLWNMFLVKFQNTYTQLIEDNDELIWALNEVGGYYSSKQQYASLVS